VGEVVAVVGQAALGVVLLLAAWWPIRARVARQTERRFERRYPRSADGVVIGAEPVRMVGSRRGRCLLLHGFNDSPQSMHALARAIHARGWSVDVPLLPGHGRNLQAFAREGSASWLDAARNACQEALATGEPTAVIGLSMGGALALILGAELPQIRAIVGIAPYVGTPRLLDLVLPLGPIASIGSRYLIGSRRPSILDRDAANAIIAYRASTARLLRELARVTRAAARALPAVSQPVLVQQSVTDPRISVRTALKGFDRIGSRDKQLDWITGAGHVLTVDYGHRERTERILAWLEPRLV